MELRVVPDPMLLPDRCEICGDTGIVTHATTPNGGLVGLCPGDDCFLVHLHRNFMEKMARHLVKR